MDNSKIIEENCHICDGKPLVGHCFVCGNSICYDCAYRVASLTTATGSTFPVSGSHLPIFSHFRKQSSGKKDAELICSNCFDSLKLSLRVAAGKTNEKEE